MAASGDERGRVTGLASALEVGSAPDVPAPSAVSGLLSRFEGTPAKEKDDPEVSSKISSLAGAFGETAAPGERGLGFKKGL